MLTTVKQISVDGSSIREFSTLVVGTCRTARQLSVTLADGRKLSLNPFAYIKTGDCVTLRLRGSDLLAVHKNVDFPPPGSVGSVQLYPPYHRDETVFLPPHLIRVTFRERHDEADWASARLLEKFHYRGKGLNRLVGRRTVLMLEAKGIGVIGYGVLSATVAAAKPRFMLFKTNFAQQMNSKLINKIARIPRVVVHPEFRGLGLGARLAAHLVEYARTRWDINGYKPIMVEVIASMTDYHRFFQASGFLDAGQTSGYANGILPQYGTGEWEARPNAGNYKLFSGQGPKPYLVYPLTSEIRKMLEEHGIAKPPRRRLARTRPQLPEVIRFRNMSVAYKANNGLTERAAEVKQVFDVDSSQVSSAILKSFSVTIEPGDVVLLTGASGSGKSTVIKILSQPHSSLMGQMDISGNAPSIDHNQVAVLSTEWDDSLPLVDQVGTSTKEAIDLLNAVGLAEAHLYVKRPSQISEGQRYRFAVARLCDSSKPLWIGDEFASSLDPRTAATVAKGLRRVAAKRGATVILAAPHIDHFVGSLAPNKLVRLHWGGVAEVFGVKLRVRPRDGGPSIWIHNTGREALTNLAIHLLSMDGTMTIVAKQRELKPCGRTDPVKVPAHEIDGASCILLTSSEGAGDLIYPYT